MYRGKTAVSSFLGSVMMKYDIMMQRKIVIVKYYSVKCILYAVVGKGIMLRKVIGMIQVSATV